MAFSAAPVEGVFPCAGLQGEVRAELYCWDARAALLLSSLLLLCIWVFPGLGKVFLTLLPWGCGEQDKLAVYFEDKCCGRASHTAETVSVSPGAPWSSSS